MGITPLNKGSSGPTNHLPQWLDPAGETLASVLWLDGFIINTPSTIAPSPGIHNTKTSS